MIIMIPSTHSQDLHLVVLQRMDNPRNERNSIILTCENSDSGVMINDARIFVNDTEIDANQGFPSGYFIHITRETEGNYSCRSSDGTMRSNTDVQLLGELVATVYTTSLSGKDTQLNVIVATVYTHCDHSTWW